MRSKMERRSIQKINLKSPIFLDFLRTFEIGLLICQKEKEISKNSSIHHHIIQEVKNELGDFFIHFAQRIFHFILGGRKWGGWKTEH